MRGTGRKPRHRIRRRNRRYLIHRNKRSRRQKTPRRRVRPRPWIPTQRIQINLRASRTRVIPRDAEVPTPIRRHIIVAVGSPAAAILRRVSRARQQRQRSVVRRGSNPQPAIPGRIGRKQVNMRAHNRLLPAMHRPRQPRPSRRPTSLHLIQPVERPTRTTRQTNQTTHHNRKPSPHETLLGNSPCRLTRPAPRIAKNLGARCHTTPLVIQSVAKNFAVVLAVACSPPPPPNYFSRKTSANPR